MKKTAFKPKTSKPKTLYAPQELDFSDAVDRGNGSPAAAPHDPVRQPTPSNDIVGRKLWASQNSLPDGVISLEACGNLERPPRRVEDEHPTTLQRKQVRRLLTFSQHARITYNGRAAIDGHGVHHGLPSVCCSTCLAAVPSSQSGMSETVSDVDRCRS